MKHLLTLTLLCFGLMAQAQIPSYVPTNGLVGWWPFNGNANDESGNGNHGTVNGATLAADRFGNAGKAYSFDGVNDYIVTSRTGPTGSGFSTSFYVKDITENDAMVIGWGGNYWGGYFEIRLNHYASGTPRCYGAAASAGGTLASKGSRISDFKNIWHHITVILPVGAQTIADIQVFQDGILQNSTCSYANYGAGAPNIGSAQPIYFGYPSLQGSPTYFNGLLDDIAIYNRALSAAEVQQLYLGCQTQPSFTSQPQNKFVAQGQTTTFAVQVDSASRYQWQMNLGLGAGWTNIPASALFSGDTTATLSVQGRSTIDGAQFRCIATSCNSDTSNAATLTVTSSANSAAAGTVAGVPGFINYQGSALDSAGKPMKNQTISLKLSVLDSSFSGAAVYVESHTAATNSNGHFAIQIGGGTATLGSFDSVGWANGRNKYLKTELSQNGTWVNLGTSQLVSVPYALVSGFSKRADEANSLRDSSGNAYQIKTVNGQPTLVAAPGSGSASNPGSFACGQSVNYAGESYPTVQIGTQCWFQKNLNVGTMILGANDQTNNSILEKYCYNNDTANCAIYGGLYQWAEAVQYQNGASNTTSPNPAFSGNVKGMCPTGWHVPSDGEWCTLTTFLDSTVDCSTFAWNGVDVGGKMKSTSGLWLSPNTGATNSSGFSALPGGYRDNGLTFPAFFGPVNFSNGIYIWSISEYSISLSIPWLLGNDRSSINRSDQPKNCGFSVRCLKD
jgi:uncharacterized protein (TIGR02145 family)